MGLCATRLFFSIGEPDLALEISKSLGEKSSVQRTSSGSSDVGVPLMRTEEILCMKRGRMIILQEGMPNPIRAKLVPYWTRKAWREATDPNPYRS